MRLTLRRRSVNFVKTVYTDAKMLLPSVTRMPHRMCLIACLVLVPCLFRSSAEGRTSWRNVNATCPKLERCECSVVNQGALTRCRNISQPQQLDADMARIEGVIHRKLTFDHVRNDLSCRPDGSQTIPSSC
ncbi:hypothetical protein MRX96_031135 [Rhipicephalus microplus]